VTPKQNEAVESVPQDRVMRCDMCRSVSIAGMLDIAVEGIPGASPTEPIYLDNVAHPAATRLALTKASRGQLHAFGINWDDTTGKNNGSGEVSEGDLVPRKP
jgi:hypothetical protein